MRLPLVLLAFLLFSVTVCQAQTRVAVVLVDQAHSQLVLGDDQPPEYALQPSKAVMLDASHYKFQVPSNLPPGKAGPNAVQFIVDGKIYSADWRPVGGRLLLEASNLAPLRDATPFNGIVAGQTVIMAVGYQELKGEKLSFYPFWVGMAKVRPQPSK